MSILIRFAHPRWLTFKIVSLPSKSGQSATDSRDGCNLFRTKISRPVYQTEQPTFTFHMKQLEYVEIVPVIFLRPEKKNLQEILQTVDEDDSSIETTF